MKKHKTELKWAFILLLATLVWILLERVAGLHDTYITHYKTVGNFFVLPFISLFVLALLDKRKNDFNGIMGFRQGLKSGLIITAILTLLSPLIQYLKATVISPDFSENAIQFVMADLHMGEAEARKFFSLKNHIRLSLMATPVMGVLVTPIIALLVRKKTNREEKKTQPSHR